MGEIINALAQQVFGRTTIDECELGEIQTLARRFPYFAPAQFLLLQKLKNTSSSEYSTQLDKCILYYHNPVAFQYLINSERFHSPSLQEPETRTTSPEGVANEESAVEQPEVEAPEFEGAPPEEEPLVSDAGHPEAAELMPHNSNEEAQDSDLQEEPAPEQKREAGTVDEIISDEEWMEPLTSDDGEERPEQAEEKMPDVADTLIATTSDTGALVTAGIAPEVEIPATAGPVDADTTNDPASLEITEAPAVQDETPEESYVSHPEPEAVPESAKTPVAESQTESLPLSFEPFHTVDYFASQGIKLSQEEFGTGKFGKQVKTFTEWLKTMKRLPAAEIAKTVDSGTEHRVRSLAQNSIHEADVWTEAMAEVWIKQGNAAKAVEVYHKLSLLNPSKNAYFAAKIEKLKQS